MEEIKNDEGRMEGEKSGLLEAYSDLTQRESLQVWEPREKFRSDWKYREGQERRPGK